MKRRKRIYFSSKKFKVSITIQLTEIWQNAYTKTKKKHCRIAALIIHMSFAKNNSAV